MPPRKHWNGRTGKWQDKPDTPFQEVALKIAQLLAESGAKVSDLGQIQRLVVKNLSLSVHQQSAQQEPGFEKE